MLLLLFAGPSFFSFGLEELGLQQLPHVLWGPQSQHALRVGWAAVSSQHLPVPAPVRGAHGSGTSHGSDGSHGTCGPVLQCLQLPGEHGLGPGMVINSNKPEKHHGNQTSGLGIDVPTIGDFVSHHQTKYLLEMKYPQ